MTLCGRHEEVSEAAESQADASGSRFGKVTGRVNRDSRQEEEDPPFWVEICNSGSGKCKATIGQAETSKGSSSSSKRRLEEAPLRPVR